jgi:BstXI restriction endonuclease
MPPQHELPTLPPLLKQKLTKTGYTRGASFSEIYQNRVTRNNTVLIPWKNWDQCKKPDDGTDSYENDFIVLIEPSWYFENPDADGQLNHEGIELGVNALLLFRKREDWNQYHPPANVLPNGMPFKVATSRTNPLGGVYFSRVHAIVSEGGAEIFHGFKTNRLRGAGIRVYEYASMQTIRDARLQLETLFWMCHDSQNAMRTAGMSQIQIEERSIAIRDRCEAVALLDLGRLRTLRLIDEEDKLACPLCLRRISAGEFLKRSEQAEGRETYDLTTTAISLFHIQELRVGKFQHKPYNLGWGHHFCNVVVTDRGIVPTLGWMREVLENQERMASVLGAPLESVEQAVDR